MANPTWLNTYKRYPLSLVRGEGSRVMAEDGRWYLDGFTGIGVMALGHGHGKIRAAVHAQVDQLMHASNLFHVPVQTAFAELLSQTFGGSVFLCNSGSEANEGAVKLARKHFARRGEEGRFRVLSAHGAFHGRTLVPLGLTPTPAYQEGFGPMPEGLGSLPAEELPAAIESFGDLAAVMVEPVQGERGCHPITNLDEIRAACDATGTLLIYDEVQCGLGRTGTLLVQPVPDIRTLAKALGGGLPLGAVVAAPDLSDAFAPGDHGSTFGGNPVACAAGLATLELILAHDLPARCERMGKRLRTGLEATGHRVTGQGLMLAAHIGRPVGSVVDAMRDQGVLSCPAGPQAVRFLPPFTISEGEVDELIAAFATAAVA